MAHCSVPSDLVATGQIPDIVLLDRVKKTIVLLELTCPFDSSQSSFKAALDRKTLRYCRLDLDCESLGFTSYNTPVEIGARGVITARNHAVLAMVAGMTGIRNVKTLRRTLGQTYSLSQACLCKIILVRVKCLAKHTLFCCNLVLSVYKYWEQS